MENKLVKNLFKGCLTVPNLLSVIRIIMVPFIAWMFFNDMKKWGVLLLALSGLTDFFDGKIARRFNQISELGKIIDPIADKLTMLTLAVIMLVSFTSSTEPLIRAAGWVFLVFLIKEGIFIVGGAAMIAFGIKPGAAELFGKIATFVFYGVMIILLLFGKGVGAFEGVTVPDWLTLVLVCISAVCTIVAALSYYPETKRQVKERFSKDNK